MNITLAESLFILHLNKLSAIEAGKVLTIVNITELVANDSGIADCCINVGVRVSENPRIDTAVGSPVVPISQNQLRLQSFNLPLQDIKEFRCVSTVHLGVVELK